MAQEFVRINRGINDINKHKKTYSNEGDLFTDGKDLYTLIKNEFVKLTFYDEYIKEIEELKEQIERCCSGVGDNNCNCDELLTEINKELEKMKNECHSSIDLIDKKVDLLDESLQLLKEKQIKNEEDLTQIQEKIEDIEDELKEIKTLINDLEENNGLSEDVDSSLKEINKKIDFMSDDIETLDGFIEDIKKELLTLNDKYLTLDDKYNTLDDKYSSLDKKVESLEGKVNNNDGKEKEELFYNELTYCDPSPTFIVAKEDIKDFNIVATDRYIACYKDNILILFDLNTRELISKRTFSGKYIKHLIIDDISNVITFISNSGTVTGTYTLTYLSIFQQSGKTTLFDKDIALSDLTSNQKKSIGESTQAITQCNIYNQLYIFNDGLALIINKSDYRIYYDHLDKNLTMLTTNNLYGYQNSKRLYKSFSIVKNEDDDLKIARESTNKVDLYNILTKEMLSTLLDHEVLEIINATIHKSGKLLSVMYKWKNGNQTRIVLAFLKSKEDIINSSRVDIKIDNYTFLWELNLLINPTISYMACNFFNNILFYDLRSDDGNYSLKTSHINDLANEKNIVNTQINNNEKYNTPPIQTFFTNNHVIYLENNKSGDYLFKIYKPKNG